MPSSIFDRHLYIDCFAGIAGDMFLGALLDLGVPEELLRAGLARLPVGDYTLSVGRRAHMGIHGCDVQVRCVGAPGHAGHAGHGAHEAHAHRHYGEIRELIGGAALPGAVIDRALAIFARLARAEARMHGIAVEEVAFHEVGAVDSIVDVVGAAIALDHLRPLRVTSRRIPLGHGTTRCMHGVLPVPSPAAVEILAGCEVEDGGAAMELTTPTGAAIAAEIVEGFGALPPGRMVAQGFGAGDNELADRPNHLRLVLVAPAAEPAADDAEVLEANIDDMSPEWAAYVMERLFELGARDVWFTPIVMKKGRPGMTLAVLVPPALRASASELLLTETTTIGLRCHAVQREVLERRLVEVQTPHGSVTVKEALSGGRVVNAAPEYESCRARARLCGVPLKEVFAAALAAYRGLRAGAEPQ